MTADKRLKVVVFDSAEGTRARGTKMLELGIGRRNDFEAAWPKPLISRSHRRKAYDPLQASAARKASSLSPLIVSR
jgi:hypothetical protein